MTLRRALKGLSLLFMAIALGNAQDLIAQDVTLQIENVLSGKYPAGGAAWVGVTCESGGTAFKGKLTLYPGQEETPLHRWVVDVDLPPNTSKTWTLPVFLGSGGFGRVEGLLDQKGAQIAKAGTPAHQADGQILLLLSDEAPAWKGGAEGRSFTPLWPAKGYDLPTRVDAYRGYAAVVADAPWLLNQPAQVLDTVLGFAEQGGTLVLALGAQGPDLARRGLPPTLARAVSRETTTVPLVSAEQFLPITPLVGGYPVRGFPSGFAAWYPLGRGRVMLLAPGLADWTTADPEAPVQAISGALNLENPLNQDQPRGSHEVLQMKALAQQFRGKHAAPFLILTGLLLVFLLLAGPGEYFFLRRKKRYALTYVTYPILVGGFTLAIGGMALLFRDYGMAAQTVLIQDNVAGETAPGLAMMTLYPNKFSDMTAEVPPGHLLPMEAGETMGSAELTVDWEVQMAAQEDRWDVGLRTWVPTTFLVHQPATSFQPEELQDNLNAYPLKGELNSGFLLVTEYAGGNLDNGMGVHFYRPGLKPGDPIRHEYHQLTSHFLRDMFQHYNYYGYDRSFNEATFAKELLLASLPPGENVAGLEASVRPGPLRLDGAWIPGRPGHLVIQFAPMEDIPNMNLPMRASVDRGWRVRRWFVPS